MVPFWVPIIIRGLIRGLISGTQKGTIILTIPHIVPLKSIQYGLYGDLIIIYPRPFSIYLNWAISLKKVGDPGGQIGLGGRSKSALSKASLRGVFG